MLALFAVSKVGVPPMNILIIEPSVQGHHGAYLRWIIRAILSRGHSVQLATFEQSLVHPSIQELLSTSGDRLTILTRPSRPFGTFDGNLIRMISSMMVFRQVLGDFYVRLRSAARLTLSYCPYLDYCTYALSVAGSPFGATPWGGITMRTAFHYSAMGIKAPTKTMVERVKKWLFGRVLREPTSPRTLHDRRSTLRICPCMATRGSFYIGLSSGSRCHQKVDRSCGRAPGLGNPTRCDSHFGVWIASQTKRHRVVVAGQRTPRLSFPLPSAPRRKTSTRRTGDSSVATRDALTAAGRLHELTHYLSEEEENTVFSSADVVWLGYLAHYQMSGVLVQAGMMGLPNIACEEGLIGWLTTTPSIWSRGTYFRPIDRGERNQRPI